MMQQQMASLVRQATGGFSPRPRPAVVSSGVHGQHRMVVRTGRARPAGRVVAVAAAHEDARPKYCRLRGAAAIAVPETSRQLLDQQEVRPSKDDTASNPLVSKDKFFEIEMKVRDDELDEYGVVNNAIYASYLHSGPDMLLEQLGMSVDYLTSTGNAMALSELNLKYFAPLRSGDRFVLKVKPVLIKGVRMIVEHTIETLPDRKLVLRGTATVVCLNKDYRPTRVFPVLSARVVDVFTCKVA